ncbi:zona pellucida sperm-binding protein 3d.2 [Genypterus blacodes]|uniref:zona pellucida sperm-binding protein 3d.2 n=1 Tax=Genypterus blacodes TaxID=154954 RepID=UPI003F76DAE0
MTPISACVPLCHCQLLLIDSAPRGSETLTNHSALPPPYLNLPVFLHARFPLVEKERFSPSGGSGLEQIPPPLRDILIPVRRSTSAPTAPTNAVKTSCKMNKMHVEVPRSAIGAGESASGLKLGSCEANKSNQDYFYFENDLSLCGTKRTMINNQMSYSNTLHFDPPRPDGPIRRAVPFTLSVSCYYNRYQYSYKIGYAPKMQMRKIFKPMKNRAEFILTPRNAQWDRLSSSDPYMIGKPMYFQAEVSSMGDGRLYVHSCYATPKKSHNSTLQFPIVTNFGCMVESRDGRSRFIPHKQNAVRFTLDAFLFKGMSGQQLYMHCTMSMGSSSPSATAKSCNYDTKAGRWVELYGGDSVCDCCNSNCSSTVASVTKMISSRPWTIESKVKPTTTQREREAVTASSSSKTTARPPTTTRARKRTTTTKPKESRAATKSQAVGKVVELARPFRGGGGGGVGVKFVEEEKKVKGFAVVEEEGEEEAVAERQRTFEDFFGLGNKHDR